MRLLIITDEVKRLAKVGEKKVEHEFVMQGDKSRLIYHDDYYENTKTLKKNIVYRIVLEASGIYQLYMKATSHRGFRPEFFQKVVLKENQTYEYGYTDNKIFFGEYSIKNRSYANIVFSLDFLHGTKITITPPPPLPYLTTYLIKDRKALCYKPSLKWGGYWSNLVYTAERWCA